MPVDQCASGGGGPSRGKRTGGKEGGQKERTGGTGRGRNRGREYKKERELGGKGEPKEKKEEGVRYGGAMRCSAEEGRMGVRSGEIYPAL